jgi:TctA family transporter
MEVFGNLLIGFETVLQPTLLFYCFFGVLIGTFIGVLPGIGSITAISLLLPITFQIDPSASLIFLAGIYYGAEYGGSITSILLNLPGTLSSAVTCIDGYPMTKNGRAGIALFMTTISSFIGGLFGIFVMIFFSPIIAEIGLKFGPTENFSLMLLGLVAASVISNNSSLKGFVMVLMGLALGTIGTDVMSGIPRFYFGIPYLMDGVSLVVLAMGFFGLSEIIDSMSKLDKIENANSISYKSMLPSKKDVSDSTSPIVRGSIIGTIFGVLPGTGPSIAAFVSYAIEKRISKHPEKFGHGAIEGVVSPEAANNSAAQTSFIPTLTLGLPGTATMALILGTLLVHGIQPGPAMISDQPVLFWGLIASFFVGNLFLIFLNIPLIGIWVSMLKIPYRYLYPIVLSIILMSAYSVSQNTFDITMLGIFGIIGYFLFKCGYEFAPLLLGFVLGPIMEDNLKRALAVSRGDLFMFVDRPISLSILILTILIISFSFFKSVKK